MNAAVHEALVGARNCIDRHGLAKHVLHDWGGGYCAFGALNMATRGTWVTSWPGGQMDPVVAGAAIELASAGGLPSGQFGATGAVVSYNNAPERTKEDMLALFDAAIAATAPSPVLGNLHEGVLV